MLLQFAEDKETTVIHPLRFDVGGITVSANYDYTWLDKIAVVCGLNDIVDLEVQAGAIVNAEDLWVGDAVVETEAELFVSAVQHRHSGKTYCSWPG